MNDDRLLVLYHADCNDGWCAALVAAHRYGMGDVELVPAPYGSPPPVTPDETAGRHVLVLDVTWPVDQVAEHIDSAVSFTVYDHHKGSRERLEQYAELGAEVVFDNGRSGARITWDELMGGDPPWIVRYVEDRDLWRFELDNSSEINAYLKALPHEITTERGGWWDLFEHYAPPVFVVDGGRAILMRDARHIERIARNADEVVLGGHSVPCVNSSVLVSELGHELAPGHPFAAVWYETKRPGEDACVGVSLRSASDGLDVSEIAKLYGGGGHKHAAGFRVPWGLWVPILFGCESDQILVFGEPGEPYEIQIHYAEGLEHA